MSQINIAGDNLATSVQYVAASSSPLLTQPLLLGHADGILASFYIFCTRIKVLKNSNRIMLKCVVSFG